ncbi:hypothetical protein BUALT_Bualt12G0119800 [Buddleja alternifolia]|uniref:non-specific serine/threonine protein kinase n=1 Tax=Buddleja alternifolia TaxID=168488 RepID=A0AAV6X1A5_9LAMI|nr:hypothetical protein BUALT_Bualt12G0119800 [Buddleja alternifolia]
MLNVSYQALLQATGKFSNDSLLGVGSYGSVYKGTLGEERTLIVVVEVLNLAQNGALKSFVSECEALRNIRHRNLVKYMPNGGLEEWLHPKSIEEGQIRNLNLVQRLSVAIDIACAVDYLHFRCVSPIIHCDLKPSNVLLDDELVGHVGDFGIARFLSKASDSFSKHQMSSSLIRGTIGYTAPEYGTGSEPSTCGDVYSFGILLLELFTGKRPTDEIFRDGFGLQNFVQNSLHDRVIDIVDPMLLHHMETEIEHDHSRRNYSSMENHKFHKCLIKVLGVGVACSAKSAKERMNIVDAVNELKSIRNALLT